MRIYVDRLGMAWWRDCYEVPEDENGNPDEKALQDAIDDRLKVEWSDLLGDTWEPSDQYQVYNEDWELIKENAND